MIGLAEVPGAVPDVRGPSLGDGEVAQEDRVRGEGCHVHPTEVGGKVEAPGGRTGLRRDGGRGLKGRRARPAALPGRVAAHAAGAAGASCETALLAPGGPEVSFGVGADAGQGRNMLAAATPVRVRAMHTVSLQLPAGRPGPAIGQGRLPSPGRSPVARGQEGGKALNDAPGGGGATSWRIFNMVGPCAPVCARLAAWRRAPGFFLLRVHAARLRGLVAERTSRPGCCEPGSATTAGKLVLASPAEVELTRDGGGSGGRASRPKGKRSGTRVFAPLHDGR